MIPTKIPYDTNTTILAALQLLWDSQKSNPSLKNVPEFAFDLVMLSRQFLANSFTTLYVNLVDVYNTASSTSADVAQAGQPLLDLLHDLDTLLFTNEHYLLSIWIADAKQWSHGNASYAAFLEYQARNQITLWGPTGEINDYASKQWAGVVGEYYAARWSTFVSTLSTVKATGATYNASEVSATLLNMGVAFDLQTWGTEPEQIWGTRGDTFEVVDTILQRWV